MERKKVIKVSLKYGTREKIAKLLKVNRTTVTFAVTGRSNTELAKKIRKAAIEMGGDPIYN
jgi:DNA-binding LacI/PurR family transcriptional regulator